MGMAAIMVMRPAPFNKFLLPHPKEAPLWNLASIGPVVSEEKMFGNVHIHTHTYIHTHIHTYTHICTYIHEAFLYYQLTYEPKGSGKLKRSFFQRKEFIFSEGTRISQWWTPLSSMPMIPIYGKNLKKSSSLEPHGRWPGNLVCSIGCSSTTKFVIIIGSSRHILWQGQIWSLMLLYEKKVKQWIFQKLLSSMIWN